MGLQFLRKGEFLVIFVCVPFSWNIIKSSSNFMIKVQVKIRFLNPISFLKNLIKHESLTFHDGAS